MLSSDSNPYISGPFKPFLTVFFLEICDGGADLLAKGDRQDLIDDMDRLQEGTQSLYDISSYFVERDSIYCSPHIYIFRQPLPMLHFLDAEWPETVEPTKKKRKRSNDQTPCSFLLSPSGDFRRDDGYLGKEKWSPKYELEVKDRNLKEQNTVAEFDGLTSSLRQPCDVDMQKNEDFPQVTDLLGTSLVSGAKCSKQFLTRCQTSKPLNVYKDFIEDTEVLNFQFEEVDDELDASNYIGKHLLRGCSSRESLALHEPKLSHGEWSESGMKLDDKRRNSLIHVVETEEGGPYCDVLSDTLEFHGMTRTPVCSLGSSWQDTDWFNPQHSLDNPSVGIGEDFNINPIDITEFRSYEDNFVKKRYFSSANVGRSGPGSYRLSSECSTVFSTSSSTAEWESDYQKGCQILEGSLNVGRMPDPGYFQ